MHGKLTWELGKFVRYKINDLCLGGPDFYVPDIFTSCRAVHKCVQVVHMPATSRLDGKVKKILTVPTSLCRSSREVFSQVSA